MNIRPIKETDTYDFVAHNIYDFIFTLSLSLSFSLSPHSFPYDRNHIGSRSFLSCHSWVSLPNSFFIFELKSNCPPKLMN